MVTGLMLFTSFGVSESSDYPNGSPAGYTGSPYDAKDCYNCHGGSTANPKSWTFNWTAPAAGTGEVTFWGAFFVGKPTTKTSTLVVQENPLIPLTVHATANPTMVHIRDSSHLGVDVSGGSGLYTYTWSSNPVDFSSTLPDPWVIPAENTIYIVAVSDEITVLSDSVEVNVSGVVTDEPTPEIGLSCFPNPVKNYLTVSLSEPDVVNAELTIYTVTGELILTRKIEGTVSGTSIQADMSSFAAGTYLLHIRDGKKQISRKIVKGN